MNAQYEFSFERGQLFKVVGGLVSLVLLVFFAGLLTGLMVQMQEPSATLVAEAPPPQLVAVPAPPPPVIAAEPVASVAADDQPAVESEDDKAAIDPDQPAVEEDKPAVAAASDSDDQVQPGIPGKFAVQLGAFLQADNAGLLAKKLEKRGYEVDVVPRQDSHGRTWYLVRYGIFPNRAEATAVAMELKLRENLDALVRPSNSM
jgi:septal ring-binding cell division protein DamX